MFPGPISGMAAADFRHDVQTDLERLLGVLQISQFLITGAQGVPDVMFVWLLSQSRSVFPDCLFIPVHSIEETHPPDIVGEAGFLLHGDEGVRQLQRPFSLGILPSIITRSTTVLSVDAAKAWI